MSKDDHTASKSGASAEGMVSISGPSYLDVPKCLSMGNPTTVDIIIV
jgi:hypothetical protein